MEIGDRKIWQVAAGDTDRNYAKLCLKWDVILNGPGSAGPWPECISILREWKISKRKISDLKRFCARMEDGHLVVLRIGTQSVRGVGVVCGEYEWVPGFGDVDGWELEHVRRVKWLWEGSEAFDRYDLKFGDTVQEMTSSVVKEWLETLTVDEADAVRHPADLPASILAEDEDVSVVAISEFLFDRGLASSAINRLVDEIGELTRIAKWYQRSSDPSESETVAYLVVPILRTLGWTPQRMAIEWNNVDVALFDRLPRGDETLAVVVEAKQKGASCLTARSQALGYAQQEGRDLCQRLIVTDGLRYGVYLRGADGFSDTPNAYLNLTRPRDMYAIYGCKGAKDALYMMSPDWRPDVP